MRQKKDIEIQYDEIEYSDKMPKKRIKKSNKKRKKNKNPIKRFIIKLILFAFLIIVISSILFLGFKAYVFKKLCTEMFNNAPSIIYDSNKNILAKIGAERNRENLQYEDIPQNLIDAYISIEDKRYFSHPGIDAKRTGGAIFSYIIHRGNSSFGGSTITQQLVKNLTGDDSNTASRKIKEWFYALTLNSSFSKEKILEAYLNIIYTGPNIYGVQEAALYYFNKDISELTLEECAFFAGLNNSPNSYNPFTEKDKKGNIEESSNISSYHSDAVINEVISDLQKKYFITKDFATNYFSLAGTNIYSTVNIDIQSKLEKEFKDSKYILQSSNGTDTSQAAMVIIDPSTRKCSCMCWRSWRKEKF